MYKPNAQSVDFQKSTEVLVITPRNNSLEQCMLSSEFVVVSSAPVPPRLARWNTRIEKLAGLEDRGTVRVLPEERHESSILGYAQMAILSFSKNVTAENVAISLLGPLLFDFTLIV